jgi:hypothetical protein
VERSELGGSRKPLRRSEVITAKRHGVLEIERPTRNNLWVGRFLFSLLELDKRWRCRSCRGTACRAPTVDPCTNTCVNGHPIRPIYDAHPLHVIRRTMSRTARVQTPEMRERGRSGHLWTAEQLDPLCAALELAHSEPENQTGFEVVAARECEPSALSRAPLHGAEPRDSLLQILPAARTRETSRSVPRRLVSPRFPCLRDSEPLRPALPVRDG